MTMEGTTASCFSVSQTLTESQIMPIHSDAKVEEPLSSCCFYLSPVALLHSLKVIPLHTDTIHKEKKVFLSTESTNLF